MITKYMKMDGKVYEVLGKGWGGYPICRLCPGLKDIPEDKPLKAEVKEEVNFIIPEVTEEVPEEVPVKRRGRRKA